MTGRAAPVTQDGQYPDSRRPAAADIGIGSAAALIGARTVLARLLGLGRTLVFAKTVGAPARAPRTPPLHRRSGG